MATQLVTLVLVVLAKLESLVYLRMGRHPVEFQPYHLKSMVELVVTNLEVVSCLATQLTTHLALPEFHQTTPQTQH